jgi:Sensors of blue-light using FAD
MLELLNRSVYQVLYHSRATTRPGAADLAGLLDQARHFNGAHQITGLLLYSDGRYVQALEGPAAEVRRLYARIQADPRHAQVTTVYAGPGPQRRFADWCMGFGRVEAPAVEQVLDVLQAAAPVPALAVEEPHLQALLVAFGYAPLAAR